MQPGWMAPGGPPQAPMDRRLVAGAVVAFVGFLVVGIGSLMFALLFNPFFGSFGAFIFLYLLSGVGYILIAVGLLVALFGIAARLR